MGVSPQRTTPSSSSLVMPLSSSSPLASPCALKPSLTILHLEDSLSVSSRPPLPRSLKEARPRPHRRPTRRNEMLARGNLSPTPTQLTYKKTSTQASTSQPCCTCTIHVFISFPKICLYFHRKEFRRICISLPRLPW